MKIYSVEFTGDEDKTYVQWESSRAKASKAKTRLKKEDGVKQVSDTIREHDVAMNKAGLLEFLNRDCNRSG